MANTDARLLDALRGGSIDAAVRVLEGIHDARALREGAARPAEAPSAERRRDALGDLVFALAQAQVQALQAVLGVGHAAATPAHRALEDALGLPRRGRAATRLRFRAPGVASQRLLARNVGAAASALTLSVGPFESDDGHLLDPRLTVRAAGAELAPHADGDGLRFATAAGLVAPGGSALVELSLDVEALAARATPAVVYRATLTLSITAAPPRAIELEFVADAP